ncbi:MAG TPA: SDR family oxidoreductase [Candidatus Acidoferrum sp.]|nr:SDR family oxidoreductase [Candidatus Acidoferrum sp.]
MTVSRKTVLVVGATGSIGRLVVEEAIGQGHTVRALVRTPDKARQLPSEAQVVIGDVTQPGKLAGAVDGIDAVVFTHGSDNAGKVGAESVDYGGVRNVLSALGTRTARIALMTSIGVTNRTGKYNRTTEAHDWKRRSERLVRASGLAYTIVRPGWFDYNGPDQHRLVLLQGDTRKAGDSSDGVIARCQIAGILVSSLISDHSLRKTFELVAVNGLAQENFDALFAALDEDPQGALDGVHDTANMPLNDEPKRVREDLNAMTRLRPPERGVGRERPPDERNLGGQGDKLV